MSAARNGRAQHSAWAAVATAVWREVLTDHASLLAAGLAYYAVFGLLPALAAAAALWGMLGDTGALRQALRGHDNLLPPGAADLLIHFLTDVPRGFGGGLAFLLNLLAVLWSVCLASSGLLTTLNIVYDVVEARSALHRLGVAFAVALGGMALLFAAVALLGLAPFLAGRGGPGLSADLLWLRWPALLLAFAGALALLFRFGPHRRRSPALPLFCGTAAGTGLCMAASCGIALYAGHLGRFGALFGSLGSVAVALLWLYGTSLALLVGAQVDAVLTDRDGGEPSGRGHTPSPAARLPRNRRLPP